MTFWLTGFLPLTSAPLPQVAMEDVNVDGLAIVPLGGKLPFFPVGIILFF